MSAMRSARDFVLGRYGWLQRILDLRPRQVEITKISRTGGGLKAEDAHCDGAAQLPYPACAPQRQRGTTLAMALCGSAGRIAATPVDLCHIRLASRCGNTTRAMTRRVDASIPPYSCWSRLSARRAIAPIRIRLFFIFIDLQLQVQLPSGNTIAVSLLCLYLGAPSMRCRRGRPTFRLVGPGSTNTLGASGPSRRSRQH